MGDPCHLRQPLSCCRVRGLLVANFRGLFQRIEAVAISREEANQRNEIVGAPQTIAVRLPGADRSSYRSC